MDRSLLVHVVVAVFAVGLVGIGYVTPASAASCEGVSYPEKVEMDGTELTLNGMGVREATVFQVNVYVAALYVPSKSGSASTLIDPSTKKKLVLTFVRGVDRSDITSAYKDSFKKAAGSDYSKLKGKLETLNGYMQAQKDGQKQVYTYSPGTGIEVEVAGEKKGTIEGKEFARYFFSIWLGDNPPNAGLKRGLLGGSCG